MRKELLRSTLAMLLMTALLGLAYPLLVTGIAQLTMSSSANGSKLVVDGHVVGSELIGQDFSSGPNADSYFQSRPSVTEYNAAGTAFSNLGPNSQDLKKALRERADGYLKRERPYNPGLKLADIPADAFSASASSVDPHISVRNAEIQAARVAQRRGISSERLAKLIKQATDGRSFGLLGEPGVNVLKLNTALDREVKR